MSGFKESAGTMTLYFKMNRHLRMMLQHGLFHLHIIVIVILEEKVMEVVVKTNEKVVAEAEVVVKSNEKAVLVMGRDNVHRRDVQDCPVYGHELCNVQDMFRTFYI